MIRVRQLLIGLASGSAFYSGLAPALGLGEITLHSALNQPLDAEIELLELGNLSDTDFHIRLAPAEVFSRSGVERIYFLNDLRFTPLLQGGRGVIRVVSSKPVREPYLNFVVEVVRPNGQLFREYTLLLDPPGSSAYRAVAAPALAPSAAPALRPVEQPRPAAPRAPKTLPLAKQGERYQVMPGDSLWKVAARLRSQGSTAAQQTLMNDIHALNPQAFTNGDSDRLRAGADLLLPDTAIGAVVTAPATPASVDSQPAVAGPADLPVDAIALEQSQVEQELADQLAQTLALQQNLAELQIHVQQLQAQMSARDRQIAGLQAELAARQASADVASPITAPLAAAGDTQVVDSNWLSAALAALALLLMGIVGVLWRGRNREPVEQRPAQPAPSAKELPMDVPLHSETTANAKPIWPAESSDETLLSANTYLAYGRTNEAAVCLKKALESQPQRSDIRFRLLEVLAQLGDAQAFVNQETVLRRSGFTPTRIDELKAKFSELFNTPHADQMDAALSELDETAPEVASEVAMDDFKLNLDELSLDEDWALLEPFAPNRPKKSVQAAPASTATDVFKDGSALLNSHDVRSPFANSMLVEEAPIDSWLGEELGAGFIEQPRLLTNSLTSNLDHLAGNRDNLAKLNMALAYIEQGSLDSACNILNELIHDGDEKLKQEARELLARIA